MLEKERVPPCGAGEGRVFLSARTERNQRCAKGAPSMNTWLAPVFIGVTPLDPHFTGAGHFGFLVNPGGQGQDRFPSYSRPTGACCHQNLQAAVSIAHRLLHPFLFGAAVVGRTSCHGFARVGGARTTQTRSNFIPGRGPCPRGKKHSPSWFYPPDETTQKTGGRPP